MEQTLKAVAKLLGAGSREPDSVIRTALDISGYAPTAQEIGLLYQVVRTQAGAGNPYQAYQGSY